MFRVEGRYAHQPMHAGFFFQIAIRMVAADLDRPRTDIVVNDRYLPSAPLRIIFVHKTEHPRPIFRILAARAGINGKHCRSRVIRTFEKFLQLERPEHFFRFKKSLVFHVLSRAIQARFSSLSNSFTTLFKMPNSLMSSSARARSDQNAGADISASSSFIRARFPARSKPPGQPPGFGNQSFKIFYFFHKMMVVIFDSADGYGAASPFRFKLCAPEKLKLPSAFRLRTMRTRCPRFSKHRSCPI